MKKFLLLTLLFPLWGYAQSPVTYFESGTKKAARGKYTAAIADFTEAIGQDTRYEKAYHQRALARIHLGDFKAAAADLTMVLMINPKDSAAFRERAGLLGAKGELAGYTAQIELDPKNINAYQQRANVKSYGRDYQGAIEDNTAVTRLDPMNVNAYANRAAARWASKDYSGAIQDYAQAAKLDPAHPWIYYNNMGIVELELKDYKAALKYYNKSIRIHPNDAAYMNRGNV
ncbi:MAG: tetratricopeptide repeat protein, partial [Hymenobacter sp.]